MEPRATETLQRRPPGARGQSSLWGWWPPLGFTELDTRCGATARGGYQDEQDCWWPWLSFILDPKGLSLHTGGGQAAYRGITWCAHLRIFFPLSFTLSTSLSLCLSLIFIPSLPLLSISLFYLSSIYALFLALILVIPSVKHFLSIPFSNALAFIVLCEIRSDWIQNLRMLLICITYYVMGNVILQTTSQSKVLGPQFQTYR